MSDSHKHLFSPLNQASLQLKNRIVMAPMTRCRATADGVPTDLMPVYYASRADCGLIITEGTAPSPNGLGYARIPGCWSDAQVKGWSAVTSAVHAKGGKIFLQIMHTGRASHPANMLPGSKIVGASAIPLPADQPLWTDKEGAQPAATPVAMTTEQIKSTVEEYAHCAKQAIKAGFDGIELHAANGYLLDQFLNSAANQRSDDYGGTPEKRQRFVLEVIATTKAAIGAERVGIRLSPFGSFNGMETFPGLEDAFVALAKKIDEAGLVYLHISNQGTAEKPLPPAVLSRMRQAFKRSFILSTDYTAERAEKDLAEGKGDLIAFGRAYIANPDLVHKLRTGAAATPPDQNTFYTPGAKGYTDY